MSQSVLAYIYISTIWNEKNYWSVHVKPCHIQNVEHIEGSSMRWMQVCDLAESCTKNMFTRVYFGMYMNLGSSQRLYVKFANLALLTKKEARVNDLGEN